MSSKYISVVYDEKSHPYTDYPKKLCSYLFQVFEMKKEMSMLEPGCGRGEFLRSFKELGLHVTGLDISNEAKEFLGNITFHECDVEKEKLPFSDNSFDIIYSKSFVEHLYYPEKYFAEAYRILKPGGILLTLVPDWESNFRIFFDDFSHRTPFTIVSLNDIYKIHGFQGVDVKKFRQLPLLWKYPLLNYLSATISPFIHPRVKNKFLRWSRELMLVGFGRK